MGVAVASRFFAVGHVVPWAKAGVGAVATQSFMNTSFGWRGLELLEKGLTPDEIVTVLVRNDDNPGQRQFGIVAADGKSATYTGEKCLAWAGGRNGPNYAVQGNILAGEKNGGDSRGKQSAALIVVKENAGYGGYTDRAVDIRVDDHYLFP